MSNTRPRSETAHLQESTSVIYMGLDLRSCPNVTFDEMREASSLALRASLVDPQSCIDTAEEIRKSLTTCTTFKDKIRNSGSREEISRELQIIGSRFSLIDELYHDFPQKIKTFGNARITMRPKTEGLESALTEIEQNSSREKLAELESISKQVRILTIKVQNSLSENDSYSMKQHIEPPPATPTVGGESLRH